jgi:hypothetical protein
MQFRHMSDMTVKLCVLSQGIRMFANELHKDIYGPENGEVTEGCKVPHNEKLHSQ